MFPTNERLDRRRRPTFCDVRQFDRERLSAASVDVSDDADEPAHRSVSTMDVSTGVRSCRC